MRTKAYWMRLVGVPLLLSAGCASLDRPGDDWWGRDKALHFAAGAAAGGAVSWAARNAGWSPAESTAAGVGSAAALGAAKECFDFEVKKTYWSWKDFAWDIAGGLAGGMAAASLDP